MGKIPSGERMYRFIRFCLVGALATAVDACLFYLLRLWLPYLVAMMMSYTSSLCLNIVLTLLWTFNVSINIRNAVCVAGAHLFNLFVVRFGLMVFFVGTLHIDDTVAFLPTLGISVLTNFLIIKAIINEP